MKNEIKDFLKPTKMIMIVHVITVIMKYPSREKNLEVAKSKIVNRRDSKRILPLDFAMTSMNVLVHLHRIIAIPPMEYVQIWSSHMQWFLIILQ